MSRRSEAGARKSLREFPISKPLSPAQSLPSLHAHENERKRINRELHDEIGQGLMTLRLSLGMLMKDSGEGPVRLRAQESLDIVDSTIEGLRRIIGRFSPKALEDTGLLGAIRREADLLSKQSGMKSHLALPKSLASADREIEIAIYRSAQEALHNISKHSGARNFSVTLDNSGKRLRVVISDDGVGFHAKAAASAETFGVAGMRERVEQVGGTLRIHSPKSGGTRIQIEIPVRPGVLHTMPASVRKVTTKAG
jgi:two-component system sensor histidine kinase UhpB